VGREGDAGGPRGPQAHALSEASGHLGDRHPPRPWETHARRPSPLSATSTGRLPPVGTDFSTVSVATSMTDTTWACSLATNSRRASALNRMPRGCFGTAIFLTTAWVAVSITWLWL